MRILANRTRPRRKAPEPLQLSGLQHVGEGLVGPGRGVSNFKPGVGGKRDSNRS